MSINEFSPLCIYLERNIKPNVIIKRRRNSVRSGGTVVILVSRMFRRMLRLTHDELDRLLAHIYSRKISKTPPSFNKTHTKASKATPVITNLDPPAPKEQPEFSPSIIRGPPNIRNYEPISVIGRGAYGKVYLIKKKSNDKLYALKVLSKTKVMSSDENVKHVMSERIILETMKHPFVITMHAAFHTDEQLCLVLDYCSGGDMFYRLSKVKRFEEKAVVFYVAEICVAMESLHKENVVYRDLKPENILIDNEGHVRLTDFGLCKLNVKCDNECITICGSADYIAPEVLLQSGYAQPVDWYQVGCLTYELLTGVPPFYVENNSNKQALYNRIIKGAVTEYPDYLSPEATLFIKELLCGKVSNRLGCRGRGSLEVKEHPFFVKHNINWNDVSCRNMPPPFPINNPDIEGVDVSNFHSTFTSMPLKLPGSSRRGSDSGDGFLLSGGEEFETDDPFHGFDFEREE